MARLLAIVLLLLLAGAVLSQEKAPGDNKTDVDNNKQVLRVAKVQHIDARLFILLFGGSVIGSQQLYGR